METTLEVLTPRQGRREAHRHWTDKVKARIVSENFRPEVRLAGRQERSAPLVADMQAWLVHHRARVATKSPLGEALAYIAKYWDGLSSS